MTFEKNKNLENLISEVNEMLAPVEKKLINVPEKQEKYYSLPVLFLLGAPRSGSTLFTQWAASLDTFAYPSNFLSRFYKAPYVGALIYKMVTEKAYQYRDEFFDINQELKFSSAIGKTKGFKAPHEFWYFWRRFYNFPDIPETEQQFLENFDFKNFNKELELLKNAFGKPFLFKAHIVNWYAESLFEKNDQTLFLHLYRDPVSSVRSMLKAREKWKGSREEWFSFKPQEYEILKNMDVYHQISGQIYFINNEILKKRANLKNRYICFSYEEFCNNPEDIYYKITTKIKNMSPGFQVPTYGAPKKFDVSNPVSDEDSHIKAAYQYFEKKYGKLEF